MVDFRNFDPSKHSNDSEGGGVDPVPPGKYVLAVKNFKRATRNGKKQIDFIIAAVLDDDLNAIAGDAYAPIWEVTTLTDAAAFRIANLLQAVGAEPPINVMSDRELVAAVRWRPFRASVVRRTYQDKVKAQIARYAPLSADDRAAFNEVADDLARDFGVGQGGGGYDDGGGYDQGGGYDAPRDGGGNGGGRAQRSRFQDDDIPF